MAVDDSQCHLQHSMLNSTDSKNAYVQNAYVQQRVHCDVHGALF